MSALGNMGKYCVTQMSHWPCAPDLTCHTRTIATDPSTQADSMCMPLTLLLLRRHCFDWSFSLQVSGEAFLGVTSVLSQVKTKLCDQPWPQRVPQRDFSFSDHEAVRAVLTLTPVKGEHFWGDRKRSQFLIHHCLYPYLCGDHKFIFVSTSFWYVVIPLKDYSVHQTQTF